MKRKDTGTNDAPDTGSFPFRERKRKHDGSVHDYGTQLVYRDRRVVIVRFEMKNGGGPPRLPFVAPPGSVSYGFFWPRRPFNLYRMLGPGGDVLGHRFDAVADVRVDGEGVDYRDLVLDWWALPDGTLTEEDRDEFDVARAAGLLSAKDIARAEDAARQVYSRYRHIIDEAEALQRRWAPQTNSLQSRPPGEYSGA
jgi:hypothetical protein